MTGLHVTGPIKHYVTLPGGDIAYFLGTSVVTPKIRVDRAYLPIDLEQGGYVIPLDISYQSKQAKVFTILNYYNTEIAYLLGCSPRYGSGPLALGRGLESFRDVGSLSLGDKGFFTLHLEFPFAAQFAQINGPIPAGSGLTAVGIALAGRNRLIAQNQVGGKMPAVSEDIPRWYRFPACVVEYEDITGGSGSDNQFMLGIGVQRVYYQRSIYKSVFNSKLAGGFYLYDHQPPLAIFQ